MKIEKIQIYYGFIVNHEEGKIIELKTDELQEKYNFKKLEINSQHHINRLEEILDNQMKFLKLKYYEYMAVYRDKEWDFVLSFIDTNFERSISRSYSHENTMKYIVATVGKLM